MNIPSPEAAGAGDLELSGASFRDLLDAALERLIPLLDDLPDAPASWPGPGPGPAPRALPRSGTDHHHVLDDLFSRLPAGINTAAPGFMGYIPGGGLPHAAIADLIANLINRYVGISPPAPHLAAIEREVVGWFAEIVGYPEAAGGTLTSGGSAANLIATVAAREDRFPDGAGGDVGRGTIYVSDQAHHSVMKAARFAAIASSRVRVVRTDGDFRMCARSLERAIARDRDAGLEPFLLVASAGTTNTGAIDPLHHLADIAERERLWFHVDAAYGGFFMLTTRGREALTGMPRADSVVLDPHKSLFLPYGTGALLVRDPARVAGALALTADYLPQTVQVEPADLSFELTRPFRALRVWLPLRLHGAAVFAQLLDEKLDLVRHLQDAVGRFPDLEIIAPAQLSTFAFACRAHGSDPIEDVNVRTRALLERINASLRVLVTGTLVQERFVIRPSIVSFRTHRREIDALIHALGD